MCGGGGAGAAQVLYLVFLRFVFRDLHSAIYKEKVWIMNLFFPSPPHPLNPLSSLLPRLLDPSFRSSESIPPPPLCPARPQITKTMNSELRIDLKYTLYAGALRNSASDPSTLSSLAPSHSANCSPSLAVQSPLSTLSSESSPCPSPYKATKVSATIP